MNVLVEQLFSMQASMETNLNFSILFASINTAELRPVILAIKMMSESEVEWKAVSKRLIEK